MKKKKLVLIILSALLILTFTTSCSKKSEVSEAIKFPIVSAGQKFSEYTAKKEDIIAFKEYKGRLVFPFSQKIGYGKDTVLTSLSAQVGMNVKKGEVLATVDDTEIRQQIEQKKTEINNTSSQIQKQVLEAELNILNGQADKCNLKAPIDGVVVDVKNANIGDRFYEKDYIFAIDSMDTAFVAIPSIESSSLQFGTMAEISTETTANISAFFVETRQNNDIFRLENLGNPSIFSKNLQELSTTEFKVKLIESEKKDVITVPNKALVRYSGNSYVYVLMNEKKIEMPVEVGVANDEKTEITGGVNSGDIVLVFE